MNILHISDTHFEDRRLDEKIRCFEHILGVIEEKPPDIAVHTGDVFDHGLRLEDPGAQAAVKLLGRLADICPVIVIKGNFSHDRNSVEILDSVRGRHSIHVSTEPEVVCWQPKGFMSFSLALATDVAMSTLSGLSVCFFSLPYPSSSFLAKTATLSPGALRQAVSEAITNVVRAFGAVQTPVGIPRVLLYHGTIKGAQMTESQHTMGMDIELSPSDLARCGMDLICAGHLHYRQRIEVAPGVFACYTGGLTYGDYGDSGEKGAWLYDFFVGRGKPDLKFNFISVPATPMRTFEIDLVNGSFVTPPAWANEICDLKVKIKVRENETQLIKSLDLKALFPNVRSITIQRIVEVEAAVRCDEVRAARSLRDKVKAYCDFAGLKCPESLLSKADLIESSEPASIIDHIKRRPDDYAVMDGQLEDEELFFKVPA